MRRLAAVTLVALMVSAVPTQAFAHHVGNAEDSMPADQWLYVDSVAHGVGAQGNSEIDIAPGDGAGAESMSGEMLWRVNGQANMNTP